MDSYRTLRKLTKPDAPELKFNDKELLKSYNLIKDKSAELSAAGLLIFGKERSLKNHFPAQRLDLIRIQGTDWGKEKDSFLSRDLSDNLISLRSIALDFLDRFFLVPLHIDEKKADRIDENPHRRVLRESLTNLLMHQNYFHRSPSQIRIYNDRIEFYNPGYSLKDPALFSSPGSELRNPSIASVFYDIGWAEAKGTGLKDTFELLKRENYPLPEYLNDKKNDTFTLVLPHPFTAPTPQVTSTEQDAEKITPQVALQVELMDRIATTLEFCKSPKSMLEIMNFLKLKDRKHFREYILNPLLKNGGLKRTIPDKPKSRFQKYITIRKK